jgi:hypothetical protein
LELIVINALLSEMLDGSNLTFTGISIPSLDSAAGALIEPDWTVKSQMLSHVWDYLFADYRMVRSSSK